jgi:hypothetical protein
MSEGWMREFTTAAAIALALAAASAAHGSNEVLNITVDDWGQWDKYETLPYLMVTCHSTDPAFAADNGQQEYAGVFSGSNTGTDPITGVLNQRYDFFCVELNYNINLNTTYNFTVYDSLADSPIQNGDPAHDGTPLCTAQKQVLDNLIDHCLGLGQDSDNARGFIPDAQNLAGMYADPKLHSPTLSNEKAAAAQILIWDIVHEPWQGRAGISLTSGTLTWTDANGNPFSSDFVNTFNQLADCAFSYNAVPEASTLLLGAAGLAPLLMTRRRNAGLAGRRVS